MLTTSQQGHALMLADNSSFRPKVGETLFMAFKAEKPFVVTITGFHEDKRFSSEQIEYTVRSSGAKETSSLDSYTFFPGISVDTALVYFVAHLSFDDRHLGEDKYFFDPEDAFSHVKALQAGSVKPRLESSPDSEYHVQVEKV